MKRVGWIGGVLAVVAIIAAGMPGTAAAPTSLVFMLDWFPNPDHVPLYAAQQEGYFTQEGVRVTLQVPANTDDPLKLAAAGRVDVAVNYEPNVILARAQRLPVRSIGVLIGQPLTTIMFLKSSGIRSPKDLVGRHVGFAVTGFADAMVDQVMRSAGASTTGVKMVNVGFDLVPALLSHKVDAVVGAYRNYERVQIELQGQPVAMFEPERYGVPTFYELVLITSDTALVRHREALQRFVRAVGRGIAFTLKNPDRAFAAYVRANPTMKLDDELNRKSFRATLPTYARTETQARDRWELFDQWLATRKVIPSAVPVDDLYTNLAR
ncbi:MAG TPA: ABC transporter substrate-binding protein [bacterium]|nr:ABC transporter substrate-binding protein [bacterium]